MEKARQSPRIYMRERANPAVVLQWWLPSNCVMMLVLTKRSSLLARSTPRLLIAGILLSTCGCQTETIPAD
jgi:hypothetical protein